MNNDNINDSIYLIIITAPILFLYGSRLHNFDKKYSDMSSLCSSKQCKKKIVVEKSDARSRLITTIVVLLLMGILFWAFTDSPHIIKDNQKI